MDALARLPSGMNIKGKKQGERVGTLFLCLWENEEMAVCAVCCLWVKSGTESHSLKRNVRNLRRFKWVDLGRYVGRHAICLK
ncbi:hypothetical protein ABIC22_001964 [Paenibacillus sp. PvP094]